MVLAYRAMGDHKSALDRASDALKLAGQDAHLQAQGHNLRGSALYALSEKADDKRMRDAESEFRAALAAQADFAPARFNLGTALLKQGRDEDGTRELKRYVEASPTGGDAGRAKEMIEDPRRARETFAPPFSFTATRGGEHVALDDLKGRTILVDVWGSWCGPCKMSTPAIVRLHKKYGEQGVVFLGIAKDREKDFNGYIDNHHLDWPQLLDTSNTVLRQFGITGYPTFIIIDGEGIIRGRRMGWGPDTESWLDSELKKSLKKGQ
jgi:thiol-disulfide isomerase/thioredoxin